jgi:hypothetical protein
MAFILAMRKGFEKRYQGIILAFSFLYGYGVYLYSGDILGYQEVYATVVEYSWSDFWFILTHKLDPDVLLIYSQNAVTAKPDIFALITTFFCSRLSENPRLFWGVVSLVFTWTMLLFFNEVKKHFKVVNGSWVHYLLIIFLIMLVPKFVGITGVRFWPALFLFMYFLFRYVNTGFRFTSVLGASFSILFHYSFFVPVLVLLIFHFVPFKSFASKALVLFSIGFFLISSTTSIFSYLTLAVESTEDTTIGQSMESYADQDIFAQRQQKSSSTNWYVRLKAYAHVYILLLAFLIEFFGLAKSNETEFTKKMMPILTIFFCVTLITFNLGSLGRFKYVFLLLTLARYVIIYPINQTATFFKFFMIAMTPVILIYIIVTLRSEFYFIEPQLLINNSIAIFFVRAQESLSEFIVGH